jgi:peptide chain release factor subunit 1
MTTTVSGDLLRELAAFRASNGCALSIYLDLDPSVVPTAPDVDTKFRSMLAEADRAAEVAASSRDDKLAVSRDVARIRRWWEDEFDRRGARGLALFISGADGLFLALPLPQPVVDVARVRGDLHVSPLVDQLRHDGALVAVVSREQGRVYRLQGARLEEILDETEEQPGRHDQGGWSQARYQRHIEHLVQQHLKTVGGAIDRRVRGGLEMVIVIPEEMRGAFAARLSAEAREAVIGWASAEAHAGPSELLRVVLPVLAEADAQRHKAVLERFQEELGRGGRAAGGWQETLDASADGRVDVLLVTEGLERTLWQCPECGRAFLEVGTCPVDGLALAERSDGTDLAVHQTLLGSGSILGFEAGALTETDGIGALLRF